MVVLMQVFGLITVCVCADGKSLFRALAFDLENGEEKYNYLWQKSVECVSNNW
jgi:hypothetical protein